jgi:UDP-N-acetylmuramate dehydrogenase
VSLDVDAFLSAIAEVQVERDAPLGKRTTFGIGGPADLLVTPRDEEQVVRVLAAAEAQQLPWFVLGGGSNLLVADRGVRGVVIALGGELKELEVLEGGDAIACGVGTTFPRLTRTALNLGWPSAIGWMGTPGQVGGALKMNAGTRHGEVGDVVSEVRAATSDGVISLDHEACGFSYRSSSFPPRAVLTRARLQCDSRQTEKVDEMDRMAKELLAKRHASQPKLRSAGSIFKNPPGDYAGRLIEAAGLKGASQGKAQISDVHANFVVNTGGATAADVVALAERAAAEVLARFGVTLEWEVKRVGEFG